MQFERFKLVDRIVEIDTGERTIRCEAAVPQQSSIFDAHFPGYPLMPGVLLLESMAQTSGWMILGLQGFRQMPFLAAAREAKFRVLVRPGDRLEMSAKIVHEGSGFALTQAQGMLDGKIACDATITFRVVDFPKPEFKQDMLKFARELSFPMNLVAADD
jgi:3-hydroxyacyl-[acyl-carrier-protein] dehydratase